MRDRHVDVDTWLDTDVDVEVVVLIDKLSTLGSTVLYVSTRTIKLVLHKSVKINANQRFRIVERIPSLSSKL